MGLQSKERKIITVYKDDNDDDDHYDEDNHLEIIKNQL